MIGRKFWQDTLPEYKLVTELVLVFRTQEIWAHYITEDFLSHWIIQTKMNRKEVGCVTWITRNRMNVLSIYYLV